MPAAVEKIPAKLVTELTWIILIDYGLQLLSYELEFSYRAALPGEGCSDLGMGKSI